MWVDSVWFKIAIAISVVKHTDRIRIVIVEY